MARQTNQRVRDVFGESGIATEWVAAACAGKEAFATAQMAHKVATKRRLPSSHYRCRACGLWHIASRRK
ncbi:hypothetical protein ACNKFW_15495 (plasmid) [Paracoccus sp. TD-10]|uniref:hypothetical protein n=1 Tax=Paracoccus sp. TD-10 TaxID=3395918 RepID=UPI003AAC09BF